MLDLLLTRDLSGLHVVDFNPYAPRTDPLLFEWSELAELHTQVLGAEIEPGVQSLSLDEGVSAREDSTAERRYHCCSESPPRQIRLHVPCTAIT